MIGLEVLGGVINARWLGPEGVGVYVLLGLIPTITFRFGNLGFGSAFSFFIAKGQITAKKAFLLTWAIGLSMSVVMTVAMLCIWHQRFSPWRDIEPHLFYLGLLVIPATFIRSFLRRTLTGQLKITQTNIAQVMGTFSFLSSLVVCVIILKMGIVGSILAFLISNWLATGYLVFQFLKKDGFKCAADAKGLQRDPGIRDLWRYCRWNYLVMLTNELYEDFPLFVLKYFYSNQDVAFFSMGRNLARRPRMAIKPFSQTLFPFTAASEEDVAIRRTNILCRNTIVMTLGLMGFMAIAAKPLIIFLYGHEFLPAVSLFYYVMPIIVLYPISQFVSIHIAAVGNPKLIFMTSVIGFVFSAVLSMLLVPLWGPAGAVISVTGIYGVLAWSRVWAYVKMTEAHWSDVLVIKKSDFSIYQTLFKKIKHYFVTRILRRKR